MFPSRRPRARDPVCLRPCPRVRWSPFCMRAALTGVRWCLTWLKLHFPGADGRGPVSGAYLPSLSPRISSMMILAVHVSCPFSDGLVLSFSFENLMCVLFGYVAVNPFLPICGLSLCLLDRVSSRSVSFGGAQFVSVSCHGSCIGCQSAGSLPHPRP